MTDRDSTRLLRRGISSDSIDQVPDMDLEQRVAFRRVNASRVASGADSTRPKCWPGTGLDGDEPDRRPHEQATRLHRRVGREPVL
ncbi:MAG TPA: hypothetical protein VIX84_09470, partial [Acidimicrobiales bacterium]